MRAIHVITVLLTLLFAASITSVFANPYTPAIPIIGPTGPAAIGPPPPNGSPALVSATVTFTYSDGSPVVITTPYIPLQLCTSSLCINVDANARQVAPGTYAYSFNQPTLTGAITISILANSLAEDRSGILFPSSNTVIGSLVIGSPSSSSSAETRQTNVSPVPQQSGYLFNQAVPATQPEHGSLIFQIILAVTILTLAAGGLVILPTRKDIRLKA